MDDQAAIDEVIRAFFQCFDNESGVCRLERLGALCAEGFSISRADTNPETLEAFVTPRRELLNSGRWRHFAERETSETTLVALDCAQRASRYQKTWFEGDTQKAATGHKFFHLVRTSGGWKLRSVLWQDDPTR